MPTPVVIHHHQGISATLINNGHHWSPGRMALGGTDPHLLAPQCELGVVTRKKHMKLLPAGFRITAPDRAEAEPKWGMG